MSETDETNPLAPLSEAKQQRIRERAYHLWEQDGRPDGQADEYWERARELQAMADSAGSGLLPADTPDRDTVVDEAALQDNLGEFPDRVSDQGERRATPMTREAELAALKADRSSG